MVLPFTIRYLQNKLSFYCFNRHDYLKRIAFVILCCFVNNWPIQFNLRKCFRLFDQIIVKYRWTFFVFPEDWNDILKKSSDLNSRVFSSIYQTLNLKNLIKIAKSNQRKWTLLRSVFPNQCFRDQKRSQKYTNDIYFLPAASTYKFYFDKYIRATRIFWRLVNAPRPQKVWELLT